MNTMPAYRSYKDLPVLAGLGTMADAMRPGLSVEECVQRVKRYHYALRRLHEIFIARIPAEPIYELKMGFSYHAYLCAEHVTSFAGRVAEMREPPLGLDDVPDSALAFVFDEILAAPTTAELVIGLYAVALPALQQALEQHRRETNPLADAPSARFCRLALVELDDMVTYGQQVIAALVDAEQRASMQAWLDVLERGLAAAGGLAGTNEPQAVDITPRYSAQPYVFDGVPQRDERFTDPYNLGVNAEAFLYDERFPANAKTLMMFYKRIREIDVPEMMASIIFETTGKPWEYYRIMTRQLWDEARHAMMGEVGFVHLEVDWTKVAVNFTWSLGLNTQLTPLERHGVLYFIEQGLMPKTGKRFEWEVAVASHDPLAALLQDYDWADEVLHAHIGRQWYVSTFATTSAAKVFGDEAWSRVLVDWDRFRRDGLTQHHNWWPAVYAEACRQWDIEPHPDALAFAETYRDSRPDRKLLPQVR